MTRDEKAEWKRLNGELRGRGDVDTRGVRNSGNGTRTAADEAFGRYLRSGIVSPELELRTDPPGMSDGSQPGQVGGTGGSGGGYTVAQGFWQNMQVALKAYGGISNDFRQIETPTGAVMPWATIDPTAVTASVVATEPASSGTPLALDNPYSFGQGVLNAWLIASSPLLVSLPLFNDSAFDIEAFVADRFGEAIGRELASLALTGTGSSQPLGIVPALTAKGAWSAGGSGGFYNLTAATSVKTFSAPTGATELVGNVLSPATCLGMVAAIDPAYYQTEQGQCKWYMNQAQAMNQHGVIDSNGRPLLDFSSGYEDGAVGRMLGFPVVVDNNIANLTASTVSGPVFGNLAHAMVQRTVQGGTSVLRLDQRWADYLSVGYLAYTRVDMRSNDLRSAIVAKPAAT
jgi:HK97 family phage major capsid protein